MERKEKIELLLRNLAEAGLYKDEILLWLGIFVDDDLRTTNEEYDENVSAFCNFLCEVTDDLNVMSKASIKFLDMGVFMSNKTIKDIEEFIIYSELIKKVLKHIYSWIERNRRTIPNISNLVRSLENTIFWSKYNPKDPKGPKDGGNNKS